MKKHLNFLLVAFAILFSCREEEPANKDNNSSRVEPIIQTYLPPGRTANGGRIIYRKPNGLVVRTSAGELKRFPFINNTFYGNGGGAVVGTGWNYNKYFPADWNNDGTTDMVARDFSALLYYAQYKNGQFARQPGDVGSGFSFLNYFIGEWATPSGADPDTPDLLGINFGGGMTVYPFKSLSNFGTGTFQNGASFNVGTIPTIYTHYFVADWSGDGFSDMIARDINGNMEYYLFTGGNSLTYQYRVGHLWNFTDYFICDKDKDGVADNMIVRDGSGNLKVFPFTNQTFYGNNGGTVLGTGFNYTNYFVGYWGTGINAIYPEIIGRDQNGNMYFHSYTLRRAPAVSSYSSPVLVGHGWNFSDYFMGIW